ncbi:hypothetical protein ACFVSN_35880 [Kitasatospora sp. NPDC057904]|uniref:hypothetical protein n=1 Tax=unclassified Kitasatospora TaxID=2633591 RepID=UPI0036DABD23
MTATAAAADAAADERWRQLQDQLDTVRERLQAETGAAIAAIDTCLARLTALRQDLADHPWTPTVGSPAADAPAHPAGGPGGRDDPRLQPLPP